MFLKLNKYILILLFIININNFNAKYKIESVVSSIKKVIKISKKINFSNFGQYILYITGGLKFKLFNFYDIKLKKNFSPLKYILNPYTMLIIFQNKEFIINFFKKQLLDISNESKGPEELSIKFEKSEKPSDLLYININNEYYSKCDFYKTKNNNFNYVNIDDIYYFRMQENGFLYKNHNDEVTFSSSIKHNDTIYFLKYNNRLQNNLENELSIAVKKSEYSIKKNIKNKVNNLNIMFTQMFSSFQESKYKKLSSFNRTYNPLFCLNIVNFVLNRESVRKKIETNFKNVYDFLLLENPKKIDFQQQDQQQQNKIKQETKKNIQKRQDYTSEIEENIQENQNFNSQEDNKGQQDKKYESNNNNIQAQQMTKKDQINTKGVQNKQNNIFYKWKDFIIKKKNELKNIIINKENLKKLVNFFIAIENDSKNEDQKK